jgi:hypothetical protein
LKNAGLEIAGCVHHPVEEVDQVNLAHRVFLSWRRNPCRTGG